MNHLAHAWPYVQRRGAGVDVDAYAVAGTSLPDWLRFIDRRARLRPDVLDAVNVNTLGDVDAGGAFAALRDGAQRHHDDDLRFHTDSAFDDVSTRLTHAFRAVDAGLRASTLGHVLTEMLVDAVIIDADAGVVDDYYAAVAAVDAAVVADFARRATGRDLPHFEPLLARFVDAAYLRLYATDAGLLRCLSGVCQRVGMKAPPASTMSIIAAGRHQVKPVVERFFAELPQKNGGQA
jgi:hypothetical protein